MTGNAMKKYFITCSMLAGLMLFASSANARADELFNYTFSGAQYGGNGGSANLSGTFTWDATTDSVTTSNIDLSGMDNGSDAGAFSCSDCSTGIYDGGGEHFAVNLGPQALYITFSNSLSLGENDLLSLEAPGEGNQPEYQGGSPFSTVAGSAVVTPEPSGLVLLLTGLLGLGFLMRRRNLASRRNVAC